MERINLDDDGVFVVNMTVDEARNNDPSRADDIETAIDNAQGEVFTGNRAKAYVVIVIE